MSLSIWMRLFRLDNLYFAFISFGKQSPNMLRSVVLCAHCARVTMMKSLGIINSVRNEFEKLLKSEYKIRNDSMEVTDRKMKNGNDDMGCCRRSYGVHTWVVTDVVISAFTIWLKLSWIILLLHTDVNRDDENIAARNCHASVCSAMFAMTVLLSHGMIHAAMASCCWPKWWQQMKWK